jgi:hypothetical protein
MQIAHKVGFSRRAERRASIAAVCFAIVLLSVRCAGSAEEASKDAAQAVGEGNAARWLDYYRRERGQEWKLRDEIAGKPAEAMQPREPAQKDTAPPPADKRE